MEVPLAVNKPSFELDYTIMPDVFKYVWLTPPTYHWATSCMCLRRASSYGKPIKFGADQYVFGEEIHQNGASTHRSG